jgi:uncharacterized membrane protein YgdD (TMEM256/DUF423 family)
MTASGQRLIDRLLILAAGLAGMAGVALSALAAHKGGAFTGTAANFLLMHAPVFLAAGLLGGGRVLRAACLVLFVGLVLFAGDLIARDLAGTRLFPFAAPTGGTLMILGWLGVALSALASRRP